jgi:hypothetical protein
VNLVNESNPSPVSSSLLSTSTPRREIHLINLNRHHSWFGCESQNKIHSVFDLIETTRQDGKFLWRRDGRVSFVFAVGDSVLTLNEMLVFAPVNETSVVVGWNID